MKKMWMAIGGGCDFEIMIDANSEFVDGWLNKEKAQALLSDIDSFAEKNGVSFKCSFDVRDYVVDFDDPEDVSKFFLYFPKGYMNEEMPEPVYFESSVDFDLETLDFNNIGAKLRQFENKIFNAVDEFQRKFEEAFAARGVEFVMTDVCLEGTVQVGEPRTSRSTRFEWKTNGYANDEGRRLTDSELADLSKQLTAYAEGKVVAVSKGDNDIER